MTELQVLKRKHSELLLKAKIKQLSYAVDVLRCRNESLQMMYKQTQKKLKEKTEQAKKLSSQIFKLKRYQYLHYLSFKDPTTMPRSKVKTQNQRCQPKAKQQQYSGHKHIDTDCSSKEQQITFNSLPDLSGNPYEYLPMIQQKYHRHFGENLELKQPLLNFITKIKSVRQQQLLSTCNQLFQQLSLYEKRKSNQINESIKEMVRDVYNLISDDEEEYYQ